MKINLDIKRLEELVEQGYIYRRKHPTEDLYIYNYAPTVQFERFWNKYTLACRGLILDSKYNVISRPFKKFFNLEELSPSSLPKKMEFEVFDKLDGSLGISYFINEKVRIATRGSFESVQAYKANQILDKKYPEISKKLDKNKTYLFEIIYPESKVDSCLVVDYGDTEDLFLLAVIDNKTGKDLPLEDLGFPIVKKFNGIKDFTKIREQFSDENVEGFVVKLKNGFRFKMKFEKYKQLHKIISGINVKSIWEYLRDGKDFDDVINIIPDEFYNWLTKTQTQLINKFQEIEINCKDNYKVLGTRKETALYFKTLKYQSVLFAMLDGLDYKERIWKIIGNNLDEIK